MRALAAPEVLPRLEVEASKTVRDEGHGNYTSKTLPRSEELEEGHSYVSRAFRHLQIRARFQEKPEPGSPWWSLAVSLLLGSRPPCACPGTQNRADRIDPSGQMGG